MRTIQMTIDEPLLKAVDRASKARRTTRSAFIRYAVEAELHREAIKVREARDAAGYARQPVEKGEFDVEVSLDRSDGMPTACAANFHNMQTISKHRLGGRVTHLSPGKMEAVAAAISFALGLE